MKIHPYTMILALGVIQRCLKVNRPSQLTLCPYALTSETRTGQQSEGTEKSSSSFSSFELEGGQQYILVASWFLNHNQTVTRAWLTDLRSS